MASELGEGLRARARRARTIAIKVRLDDWTTVTRARTIDALHRLGRDDRADRAGAAARLRAAAPGAPARRAGRLVRGRGPHAAAAERPGAARAAARETRAGCRARQALAQITETSPAPSASLVA